MRKRLINLLLCTCILLLVKNNCFSIQGEPDNKEMQGSKAEQEAAGNSVLKLIKSEPLSIGNEELGFWPDGTVFNKRGARKDIEERIKAEKIAKYGAKKAIKEYGEKDAVESDLKTTFWSEVSPDGKYMIVRQLSKFGEHVADADSVFMTIDGKELWRGAWTPYYLMPEGFTAMFSDELNEFLALNNDKGKVIFNRPLQWAIVKASDRSESIAVCGSSSGKYEITYMDKNGKVIWGKKFNETIKAMGVSPDGEWVGIYTQEMESFDKKIWDLKRSILLINKKGETVWEITDAEIYTSAIYFTADSKRVVIGTFGARKVYDVLTGKYLFSFAEDNEGIQQKDYVIYTYQGILYITNTKGDVLVKKEFKETTKDKDTLEKRVKENPGMRELYEVFAKKTVKKVHLDNKINHNRLSVALTDEVRYYDISGIENAVPVKTQKQKLEEWKKEINKKIEKDSVACRVAIKILNRHIELFGKDKVSKDYSPGYTLGEALEREEKEIAEIENKYGIILSNISILKDRYDGRFVPGRRIDIDTDYCEIDALLYK